MARCVILAVIFVFRIKSALLSINASNPLDNLSATRMPLKAFIFWPNGTVPFYIDNRHYDPEQSVLIMQALSKISFKTCIKFVPVLDIDDDDHAMIFENKDGVRQCVFDKEGHAYEKLHPVVLGYDCLKPPNIYTIIMRSLGFPFEHNRAMRDVYIDVQFENIEPAALNLYTKDHQLPLELRQLPYDMNSVMHFDDRMFSKNGHKTLIFKDLKTKQNRVGLTENDVRRIEIVYGSECLKRDRQEKVEMCQNYPGIKRRKRSANSRRSLRVNPEITPPPEVAELEEVAQKNASSDRVAKKLKEYGVEQEMEDIIDKIYKLSHKALAQLKNQVCNKTKPEVKLNVIHEKHFNTKLDIFSIVETIVDYTENMVAKVASNITEFCSQDDNINLFLRYACFDYSVNSRCTPRYRSTKTGDAMYSTQHKPWIRQSTIHRLRTRGNNYNRAREDDNAESVTEVQLDKTSPLIKEVSSGPKTVVDKVERRKREVSQEESVIVELSTTSPNEIETLKVDKDLVEVNKPELDELDPERAKYEGYRRKMRNRHDTYTKWYKDDKEENVSEDKRRERKEKLKRLKKEKYDRMQANEMKRKGHLETVPLSKLNKEFYGDRKWPNGIVPYIITEYVKYDIEDLRRRLNEVIAILNERTCVRMIEIFEEDVNEYADYLVLNKNPDYVTGRVGGRQDFGAVELFVGGQHRQHAAMMVMAMLGFYFEVSRHDRDNNIIVHVRHIRPDKLHHFEKIREDATLDMPYDYESATHPSWQFWRRVGKTGISSVATFKEQDPTGEIMNSLGQHEKLLSEWDIIKINSVYGLQCKN